MNRVVACVAVVGWSMAMNGAELVHARDGSGVFGYKDTPKLPWIEFLVHDPDRPAPRRVTPGAGTSVTAPSDAVVLFDGKDLSQWESNAWKLADETFVAATGKQPRTKETFGSFQLHVEWMTPEDFKGTWDNQGNNGVLIHDLYEIQIFDSYNVKWAPDGQCAAVYGQTPPLVNVCRPPGQWQSFDITFTAPVIKEGKVEENPRITMYHNGVLVHLNQEIFGGTGHRTLPRRITRAEGAIGFGAHGCPVRFKNIWIRRLQGRFNG